jgi:hypothetical protein
MVFRYRQMTDINGVAVTAVQISGLTGLETKRGQKGVYQLMIMSYLR